MRGVLVAGVLLGLLVGGCEGAPGGRVLGDDDGGGDDDTLVDDDDSTQGQDPEECQDDCASPGDLECAPPPDAGVLVCADFDADPCLEWGGFVPCGADETCVGGVCQDACVDECSPAGAQDCNQAHDAYVVCGDHDADPCLEWSTVVPCDPDEVCDGGECVEECADEYEACEEDEDCCDLDDYHCCPFFHICVPNWWE